MALSLHTSDGHSLAADLAAPAGDVVGAVVLCHPHPQYGGNRFNDVVDALFRALPPAGFTTLRFDFRAAHGGGVAERLDLIAAIDQVATSDARVFVVGYSFGALVALSTPDERIGAIVAIAPPLGDDAQDPGRPTLVLAPRHDQFCPPERAAPIVGGWRDAELQPVEGADHFLLGHATEVAERATGWLTGVWRGDRRPDPSD